MEKHKKNVRDRTLFCTVLYIFLYTKSLGAGRSYFFQNLSNPTKTLFKQPK